jgi:hypothetical protein
MEGVPQKKFSTPEEERAFLCAHVAELEKEHLDKNKEFDADDAFMIKKRVLREYAEYDPRVVLSRGFLMSEHFHKQVVAVLATSHDREHDILNCLEQAGIRNTLLILEEYDKTHLDKRIRERLFNVIVTQLVCS